MTETQFAQRPATPGNFPQRPRARAATIRELQRTLIAAYLAPVPSVKTLRAWFKAAGIPTMKANPVATHGGGECYYSVSAIEKMLRARIGLVGAAEVEGTR